MILREVKLHRFPASEFEIPAINLPLHVWVSPIEEHGDVYRADISGFSKPPYIIPVDDRYREHIRERVKDLLTVIYSKPPNSLDYWI